MGRATAERATCVWCRRPIRLGQDAVGAEGLGGLGVAHKHACECYVPSHGMTGPELALLLEQVQRNAELRESLKLAIRTAEVAGGDGLMPGKARYQPPEVDGV